MAADTSRMKPDFAVYLDGNKLTGEEAAAIIGIRVFQTRFGASAFELVVSDPDLKWQGKPTFTECKEVKIELGVPGKLKAVFDGEVTAWRTELERSGPTVIVVRGMDRSHRMMRAHKTKTYPDSTPLDCVNKIAGDYGLTAKTKAGQPAPVKMFRFQANQTDFDFLRSMADLEGYMFWVEAKDLHFERPELSSTDDCTFTFGEDLKTFLPTANFRKPAVSVEVGAWDTSGKAEITGKAKKGDELWNVPGKTPGADKAKFTSSKTELSLVESQVGTQDHADTVAKAALTKRAMEFITAEVEVQGNPAVKPGAMVNLKKVGEYSGHYYVTEANHFYDAAGYNCIFYVARDKWGDSSNTTNPNSGGSGATGQGTAGTGTGTGGSGTGTTQTDFVDFTLQDDQGKPLSDLQVKIHFANGEVVEATTDGSGHVHLDKEPQGAYTVEILGAGAALTFIDIKVEDAAGNPISGASGTVTLSDGSTVNVMTDVKGEVHLTDVPVGQYTFKLDDEGPGGTGGTGTGGTGGKGTGGTGSTGTGGTGSGGKGSGGTGSTGTGGTGSGGKGSGGTGSTGTGGTGSGGKGSGGTGSTGTGGTGTTGKGTGGTGTGGKGTGGTGTGGKGTGGTATGGTGTAGTGTGGKGTGGTGTAGTGTGGKGTGGTGTGGTGTGGKGTGGTGTAGAGTGGKGTGGTGTAGTGTGGKGTGGTATGGTGTAGTGTGGKGTGGTATGGTGTAGTGTGGKGTGGTATGGTGTGGTATGGKGTGGAGTGTAGTGGTATGGKGTGATGTGTGGTGTAATGGTATGGGGTGTGTTTGSGTGTGTTGSGTGTGTTGSGAGTGTTSTGGTGTGTTGGAGTGTGTTTGGAGTGTGTTTGGGTGTGTAGGGGSGTGTTGGGGAGTGGPGTSTTGGTGAATTGGPGIAAAPEKAAQGGGPGLGTILGVGAGAAAVAGVATAVAKSGKDAADSAPKNDDDSNVEE